VTNCDLISGQNVGSGYRGSPQAPPTDPYLGSSGLFATAAGSVRRETVAGRRVFELRSYGDAQLFRFDVPADSVAAVWRFSANHSSRCRPRTVSV